MNTFRELLIKDNIDTDKLSHKEITEGIEPKVKDFMSEFNKQISYLKEDIKNSDSNKDYMGRLESINILISKFIKKQNT